MLYSFQHDSTDGANPTGPLIYLHGKLYGTTTAGGMPCGCGTVYSIDPANGAESVLYTFSPTDSPDGANPLAGLIDVRGTLYGTTALGGDGSAGTVFSIDPLSRAYEVIHWFGQNGDGSSPEAPLVNVAGTLYGTTFAGGINSRCIGSVDGCGTVFAIDLHTGAESVIYRFQNNHRDGVNPTAGLIAVNGTLFGTTLFGGSGGSGSVFSVDPVRGQEFVLHSFNSRNDRADGIHPYAGLMGFHGVLYGDTEEGGEQNAGTVFEISLPQSHQSKETR